MNDPIRIQKILNDNELIALGDSIQLIIHKKNVLY